MKRINKISTKKKSSLPLAILGRSVLFFASVVLIGIFLSRLITEHDISDIQCNNKVKFLSSSIIKGLNIVIGREAFVDVISFCLPDETKITNKKNQNKQIKNEIETCFWKFGEGDLKFLTSNDVEKDTPILCLPCSKIILKEKFSYQKYYSNYLNNKNDIQTVKIDDEKIPFLSYVNMLPPLFKEDEILNQGNTYSYLEEEDNEFRKLSYLTDQTKLNLDEGEELYISFQNVISKTLEETKAKYGERIEDNDFFDVYSKEYVFFKIEEWNSFVLENSLPKVLEIDKNKIGGYFLDHEYKCLKNSLMVLNNCGLTKNKYDQSFTFFFYKNIILNKKSEIKKENFEKSIDEFFKTRKYSSENGFTNEMKIQTKNKMLEFYEHFFNLNIDERILKVKNVLLTEEEKEEEEIANKVYKKYVNSGKLKTEKYINNQLEKLKKKHNIFLEEKEKYIDLRKEIIKLESEIKNSKKNVFDETLLEGEDKVEYEKMGKIFDEYENKIELKKELETEIISYNELIKNLEEKEIKDSIDAKNLGHLVLGLERAKGDLEDVSKELHKKEYENIEEEFKKLKGKFSKIEKYANAIHELENSNIQEITNKFRENIETLAKYQRPHFSYFNNLIKAYDYLILCNNELSEDIGNKLENSKSSNSNLNLYEESEDVKNFINFFENKLCEEINLQRIYEYKEFQKIKRCVTILGGKCEQFVYLMDKNAHFKYCGVDYTLK